MNNGIFPWVGGKGNLLWIIDLLSPARYDCFVDVFGGSGTVTMSRQSRGKCINIYNDVCKDLVNLFMCARDRPMALIKELGFLPLHSRSEFEDLCRFLEKEEFRQDYLQEEIQIAQDFFPPEDSERLCQILAGRAELGDVQRAAAYYRKQRESFNAGGKVFAGKPVDITHFLRQLWDCSRKLRNVVLECRDFEPLTCQYDRPGTFFYCDPPYYKAEKFYEALFTHDDHIRLHEVMAKRKGYVMVSYNCCEFILELYQDFFIFQTERSNSLSHSQGAKYLEYVMTNYDPNACATQTSMFGMTASEKKRSFTLVHSPKIALKE